jgi:hypothetical protein
MVELIGHRGRWHERDTKDFNSRGRNGFHREESMPKGFRGSVEG